MNVSTVLKYPGSKWSFASWIIDYIPKHATYLEPYFGSGAVFFNKPPSRIETINDIDSNVVNLFKVIRDFPEQLAHLINMTPWSRKEYTDLLTFAGEESYFKRTGDPVEDARRFLSRMWQARGSKTSDRSGWRHDIRGRKGTSCPRSWAKLPDTIIAVAERLKQAQIECQPAVKLIERYRYHEVLIYADPPYPLSTRSKRMYKHEMTDDDHMDLLNVLDKHPGPVLLSSYSSELYINRLKHWESKVKRTRAEGGVIREERLWLNQMAAREMLATRLF